jgi:putative ABC transport system permease protein
MTALAQALAVRTPLGWRQLRHRPSRLAVALAGIVFADLLIFMQLGVMGALFETAVSPVRLLKADILLLSPDARQFGRMGTLPRRRLYQALGVAGVVGGAALQVGSVDVRPSDGDGRARGAEAGHANVMVFGVDPDFDGFVRPEIAGQLPLLRAADTGLLDRLTRAALARLVASVARSGSATVEIAGRMLRIGGLFSLGASFDNDGSLIVSDQTFLRLFPSRSGSAVSAVLLRTDPGVPVDDVLRRLRAALPGADAQALAVAGYAEFIQGYMRRETPVGFVFTFGVVFGCVIGFAITYQVLSADVNDHLSEYAVLRAMGFTQRYLLGVVFEQAALLAGLGFVPAVVLAFGLYGLVAHGTELAVTMPPSRPLLVGMLTIAMCAASGALATRRLAAADPADVF